MRDRQQSHENLTWWSRNKTSRTTSTSIGSTASNRRKGSDESGFKI